MTGRTRETGKSSSSRGEYAAAQDEEERGVIPGRATREPGISQSNIEIPGLRLPAHPGMTEQKMQGRGL
jgi:hypothetical protein